MSFKIPIWIKLFLMTVIILLSAMIPTAYTNHARISSESIDREWQIVSQQAESRAQETRLIISHLMEKSQFLATQFLTLHLRNEKPSEKDLSMFTSDPYLLNIEVIKVKDLKPEVVFRETQPKAFSEYKLHPSYFIYLRERSQFNLSDIFEGQVVLRNVTGYIATSDPHFGLFTIGLPFSKDQNGKIDMILIADIHLSALQKPFLQRSESLSYLTDDKGVLLAHADASLVFRRQSFSKEPLLVHALENLKTNQFQSKFADLKDKSENIGVYSRTGFGPIVVFQTPLSEVLAPAESVKREFIKNLAYAFFASIVMISLFSISLTKPLERLAGLIHLVSKGQFDLNARELVNSNDEVGDLAVAFDQMTVGLKERDKVKNLLSKFHGSSIAESLINSDLVLGGKSKDVIVFFSDIRGFTAFSESRDAQEVVDMLNEYFGIMVGIINRNGGVVDKFIGDAIMAVWGAPETSSNDARNAVRACLEMREALNELNQIRLGRGQNAIQIGMGLHAGEAISGTIGSSERMEYTVIGNTVNTASRVEASTKSFGTDLLITEQVIEKLADQFLVERAGAAEVKGRAEPITMFKVRGYKNENGLNVEVKTPYSDYEAADSEKIKRVS
ncbi:MAG: hypothetical protein A2622_10740 [Bdellovibrionales bacterium RIFCSPHIGHO2_01_FULL_40_29]|nr:MAG: hypothetical protein A2622_10740 [Bdellovibrionales bacterium RIFCSPHIGHO2_01_FULL_40_29]OFZ34433.1 MAG: hypothetical protein A3D17_01005 [Bdellovibrionales bacterium RIFCSPHIGHO2_02_FULL_40_15]